MDVGLFINPFTSTQFAFSLQMFPEQLEPLAQSVPRVLAGQLEQLVSGWLICFPGNLGALILHITKGNATSVSALESLCRIFDMLVQLKQL